MTHLVLGLTRMVLGLTRLVPGVTYPVPGLTCPVLGLGGGCRARTAVAQLMGTRARLARMV